jgi:predicted dehydrogenase
VYAEVNWGRIETWHPAPVPFFDVGVMFIGSFQDFDTPVEVGPYGESYEPVAPVREPFHGTAWARGVADMADAITEDRPHRASAEQAAHVVEILESAAASIADGGRSVDIESSFTPPELMPWAQR